MDTVRSRNPGGHRYLLPLFIPRFSERSALGSPALRGELTRAVCASKIPKQAFGSYDA